MKAIGIAILAASMLAGVSGASAAERESVSLKIDSSGVNFADPASVAQLRRQMERQIEAVCNPGDRIDADMMPDFRCRQEMAANLEPVLSQLVARASDRQLARNN